MLTKSKYRSVSRNDGKKIKRLKAKQSRNRNKNGNGNINDSLKEIENETWEQLVDILQQMIHFK